MLVCLCSLSIVHVLYPHYNMKVKVPLCASPSLAPRLSGYFTLERLIVFSRDLTYVIARGQDRSKDCCASLPFAGECFSAQSVIQTGSKE